MPTPDIGLAPPPPPDVAAQLQPSAPGGQGAPNLQSILAGLAGGGGPPPLNSDITPKVLEIQPMLFQLARQVPAMGPDVDRLNVELESRMGGLPAGLAGMANQAPPPGPGITPMGPAMGGPMGQAGMSWPPAMSAGMPPMGQGPGAMPPMPPPAPAPMMGAMDTAMQLEIKLPTLGQDDSTLMPYIQGFIARMREEVPKVAQGETESISPPVQTAPTESMLSKIPATF